MHLNEILVLAQAAAPAAAQAASSSSSAAAPGATPQGPGNMIFLIAIMGVMMYFLMIRPQSQQRKKQAKLLAALKSGDKVVTSSGIHGVVITVKEHTVSIRSHESKMEVAKSSIVQILEGSAAIES